jgi:uncharacterized membrane protein YeaQ/YmgE (transglycosylase-associated protein family)
MQAAPAISADLDDGRPERVLISLLHALTGAAVAAWAEGLLDVTPSVQGWIVAIVAGLASAWLGAGLARRALPANAECLRWDGQAWSLVLRAPVGGLGIEVPVAHMVVSIDLGPWLLLRAYAVAGGSRWQVARASCVGAAAWHGLRVALKAHAGSVQSSPGDQPQP